MSTETPHNNERWRVIAADDDPIMRELIKEKLGRDVDVECAEDGEQAWNKLVEQKFDLAIIDLSMPKLDGFSLIEHLRQTPRTVDLPIIVATSRGDSEAIERAFNAGATNFVTKPINWSLFRYQVQFVLKQGDTERKLRLGTSAYQSGVAERSFLLRAFDHAITGSSLGQTSLDKDFALPKTGDQHLNHLVQLARLLEMRSIKSCEPVDIHALLNECTANGRMQAGDKPVTLLSRPTLEHGNLNINRAMILDAMSRLTASAINSSPDGGTVEILAHKQPDQSLVLTVRDGGIGIEPARLERFLGPLNAIPVLADGEPDILGLDYYTVRKIAELHGGRLVAQSIPGRGTVAGIWLPKAIVALEQLERTA